MENWTKETRQPENEELCNIYLQASFRFINSYTKEYFKCFELELLMEQPCWFTLYQWRADFFFYSVYLMLLLHMLA